MMAYYSGLVGDEDGGGGAVPQCVDILCKRIYICRPPFANELLCLKVI